ncbi:hypothetical protein, partial [Frankia canadensis]|uniref:hypothetical protein n=1 Tax=Frankia canadensis TaxID=1836972 RepID=UPI000C7BDC5A
PTPLDVLPPDGVVPSPSVSAGTGGTRSGDRGAGATAPAVAPRPSGPVLGLSATSVDLGAVDSVWRVDLRGDGTAPVDVAVGSTPSWLAVVPNQRRVDPGVKVPLVITLDRAAAPEGTVDVTVPVTARTGVGGADLRITAKVDGSPRIVSVTAAPARIVRSGCPATGGASQSAASSGGTAPRGVSAGAPAPPPGATATSAGAGAAAAPAASQTTVTVTTDDAVGIFAVQLAATLPGGRSQTLAMNLGAATGDRSTWTGQLTAPSQTGTITYTAAVTDLNGKRAQYPGSLPVLPCPS